MITKYEFNMYQKQRNSTLEQTEKDYEAEVITRGNCMMCGKELDEGLFFCKECEVKTESEEKV